MIVNRTHILLAMILCMCVFFNSTIITRPPHTQKTPPPTEIKTQPPPPTQTICASLSNYDIEVSSTQRITFKDRSTALIAGNGAFDDLNVDGGTKWYNTYFNHWEYTTFLIFRALIKPDTVYVGFGEWIGPTIMYSSQLAKASYGFEPDVTAFRSLALNAMANQCFNERLKIYQTCIHKQPGTR